MEETIRALAQRLGASLHPHIQASARRASCAICQASTAHTYCISPPCSLMPTEMYSVQVTLVITCSLEPNRLRTHHARTHAISISHKRCYVHVASHWLCQIGIIVSY